MDANQRFLRRLHLLDNLDMLLRESRYHRNHKEDERLTPVFQVWNWDDEEGAVRIKDDRT